jgi:Zn-dependent M28 family amino/carboxypeptidase
MSEPRFERNNRNPGLSRVVGRVFRPADLNPHPAASALAAHIETLATKIGERNVWNSDALERAATYIENTFGSAGYQARRQNFDADGVRVSNIEAVLAGTSLDSPALVLGAHYDSVRGCPGANDNGTGVAAVLELARRFARRPRRRTIRFVAFVNEEPPFFQTPLMGSVFYARAARSRRERLIGMLSLETIGCYSDVRNSQKYPISVRGLYPDTGNFIAFVSNLTSARLLMRARRAFRSRTAFPVQCAALPALVPGVGWSDQWAFWQSGYRAMMVTDTAPFRYPWYHTPYDTPDKICLRHFAQVVDGLEHVVDVLAS